MYTHVIVPTSPARITNSFIAAGTTSPFAIVAATDTPNANGPMKLNKAAMMAAALGDNILVATMVDMEFAESFIPFPKSNMRAMMIIIAIRIGSAIRSTYPKHFSPLCSL